MMNLMYVLDKLDTSATYECGSVGLTFSGNIPNMVYIIKTAIWIIVPILLVIFGLLDLAKAVMAQKEDEIKKGQQTLLKRAIAAAIVFFVVPIVSLLINFVSGKDSNIISCFNCFINGREGEDACKQVISTPNGM